MVEQSDDELEKIRIQKLKDFIDRQQSITTSENGQNWQILR